MTAEDLKLTNGSYLDAYYAGARDGAKGTAEIERRLVVLWLRNHAHRFEVDVREAEQAAIHIENGEHLKI